MTTLLVSDSPEVTYCRHCDLFFGTLVEGNGVVRCPRCRQPNDSTAPGIIQLDSCTFPVQLAFRRGCYPRAAGGLPAVLDAR